MRRCGPLPPVPMTGEPGRALGGISRAEAGKLPRIPWRAPPTEDEWTFAAGGARPRRYPWGDHRRCLSARRMGSLRRPPLWLRLYRSRARGLPSRRSEPRRGLDSAGNVAEWVIPPAPATDDLARGGSFASGLATELRTWRVKSSPAGLVRPRWARGALISPYARAPGAWFGHSSGYRDPRAVITSPTP